MQTIYAVQSVEKALQGHVNFFLRYANPANGDILQKWPEFLGFLKFLQAITASYNIVSLLLFDAPIL